MPSKVFFSIPIGATLKRKNTGAYSFFLRRDFLNWDKGRSLRTSGKLGHKFAKSENPDETAPYEPSHQDFHCLLSLYVFYSKK